MHVEEHLSTKAIDALPQPLADAIAASRQGWSFGPPAPVVP
jgi:hypothetical protein